MKTNASSSTLVVDSTVQPYQQFPAQAARIPGNHSQAQFDQQSSQANGSPLQHSGSREQTHNSAVVTSPHLASLSRETSWPVVEGFGDLHLSGSEPRIFPGIVSRTQRRDSLVRRSGASEMEEQVGVARKAVKGKGKGKVVDGAVGEESDGDMEEAGGMDDE